jgi:hypothetical protein
LLACASKTVVFEFVDSMLNVEQICLAPLSPLALQGDGRVRVLPVVTSPPENPLTFILSASRKRGEAK